MDKKFKNDQRPVSSRLISAFNAGDAGDAGDDAHASDGTFTGEHTIPGAYGSLPEVTEHDGGREFPSLPDLGELIDPATLDAPPLAGDTLDHEFADFTQTDLQAVAPDDARGRDTRDAMRSLLLDCLGVIDDLERLAQTAREPARAHDLSARIAAAGANLLDRLAAHGVKHEPSLDAVYDPEMHEIAGEQTVAEPARDGVVVAVERAGYTRHGHPLRRAQVVVGKKG